MSGGQVQAARRIADILPGLMVEVELGSLLDQPISEVTSRQLLALLLVHESGDLALRTGELAELLGVSRPSVTALVDRLVERDLLQRDRASDRRVVLLKLSQRGREVIRIFMSGLVERIAAALGSMDASARASVEGAFKDVAVFARRVGRVGARLNQKTVVE